MFDYTLDVETVIANGKKRVHIRTEGANEISFDFLPIKTLDRITYIGICDDFVVIKTVDRDFRNGNLVAPWIKDDRTINNVDAYTLKGEHLWNIGEIIGDIKAQIDNISFIDTTEAKREFGVRAEKNARLLHCTALGWTFIIDAVNRKQLCKVGGRVK